MNIINWRCTQVDQICTLCQTERLNVIIVFMLLERENSFFYCVIPTCTNSFQVVHVQDFLHCLINCRKAERSDRGNNCRRSVGTRQWSIALVYPRPLIKPHYDGHHGIDIYLQDNASPPVWWRIAWELVMTKRPGSRNSVKIAMLKTTRSVRRSMLMNSIGMTFDF